MKVSELLVSSLNITEDDYNYKGLFTLSAEGKSKIVDIAEFETDAGTQEVKNCFDLEEEISDIRKIIKGIILEKSSISSKINEGESYNESSSKTILENSASSLDRA